MPLDLRFPSGLFFAIVGMLLIAVSFSSPRAPMTDSNVDLWCGLAMLAFGGLLLALAMRSRRT